MLDRCEACGLKSEREQGYFLGAMYVSYALAIPPVLLLVLLIWKLTGWPYDWFGCTLTRRSILRSSRGLLDCRVRMAGVIQSGSRHFRLEDGKVNLQFRAAANAMDMGGAVGVLPLAQIVPAERGRKCGYAL